MALSACFMGASVRPWTCAGGNTNLPGLCNQDRADRHARVRLQQDAARVAFKAICANCALLSQQDADTKGERLAVEDKLVLETTAPWLDAPSTLLLPHNGRTFEIKVIITYLWAEVAWCMRKRCRLLHVQYARQVSLLLQIRMSPSDMQNCPVVEQVGCSLSLHIRPPCHLSYPTDTFCANQWEAECPDVYACALKHQ